MTLRDAHSTVDDLAFRSLADELMAAIRHWEEQGEWWSDGAFNEFAHSAFELQYDEIVAYRRYCDRRGATPAGVTQWTEIPPVPVTAFRHVPLIVGDEAAAQLVFLTSGTTAGPTSRGRHLVREPALYRASMEAAFRRLVPGGEGPRRFASLVPPFPESSGSSLAWMIDGLMACYGDSESRHLASESGLDWDAAAGFMDEAVADRVPTCILATTMALDAWLRQLRNQDRRWQLPAGSVVMDTGGAKGRHELKRADVCAGVRESLGVESSHMVNEFGMTELLSQLYSVPSASGVDAFDEPGGEASWLRGPPWLRVRALDPNDLSPLPDDEPGLLCYFDLANLGSVSAVLTEDIGRVRGRAVQWLRRTLGSPPRGCSLATAELLAAQESLANG